MEILSVSTVILSRDHRQIIFEWNNYAIIIPLSLNTTKKPLRPISGYLWNNLEITIAGTNFNYLFWSSFPCLPHGYNFSFVIFFPVTFVHTFFHITLQVTSSLATPARLSSLNNQPMSLVESCADPEIFIRGGPTKMVIFGNRRGGVQPQKNPEITFF